MGRHIDMQLTSQGVLIPLQAVQEWLEQGLEIVKDKEQIVIRPKHRPLTDRESVLQVLEDAGLLVPPEPLPADYKPLSPQEKVELSRKLSVGQPLSEIIIKNRKERV